MKVRLIASEPGWAKFLILEGPNEGEILRTSWDPEEGGLPIQPGDESEIEIGPGEN